MRYPLNRSIVITNPFGRAGKTKWYSFHDGVDLRAKYEPVLAPEAGTIIKYYNSPKGGKTLILRGRTGEHIFHHLSNPLVSGRVKEGETIAISGNSGKWTTAPHLHWGLKIKGKFVNPTLYIKKSKPKPKGGLTMGQYDELKTMNYKTNLRISELAKLVKKLQKEISELKKKDDKEFLVEKKDNIRLKLELEGLKEKNKRIEISNRAIETEFVKFREQQADQLRKLNNENIDLKKKLEKTKKVEQKEIINKGVKMSLNGNKTYLAAAIFAVLVVLKYLGYVEQPVFEVLAGLDVSFGAYAVRDAIKKAE